MKGRIFWVTLLLLLISFHNLFAQGTTPCDPDDPSTCPLDTWVWVLVAAAFIFATIHLHHKQKAARAIKH
jgi:DMSO reductase anchor subunit